MAENLDDRRAPKTPFQSEVENRFGILPNFFCSAKSAPGLIEELWGFAKSAYLDSPLPSLFKERLFVHLSRFCEVRYCIIRHVGFLIGHGRPAGDRSSPIETVERVIALLRRPVPDAGNLASACERLRSTAPSAIPEPETQAEADLFDALTAMFIDPSRSGSAREAVKASVGESIFEILTAYLAFIRTAHYWTETHPELDCEPDMLDLMAQHPDLTSLLRDTSDAERAKARLDVLQVTAQLQKVEQTKRLLLNELNHRVKNTLASVQSIAQITLQGIIDPTEFAKAFAGRVQSLSRVHNILTDATWDGADLRSLVNDQLLSDVMEQQHFSADGPEVQLPPNLALHLAPMLHELGTNAAKYGALSVPGGSVSLDWSIIDGTLKLRWKERGGPRVKAPSRRGFGSRLIETTANGDGGTAKSTFEVEGVTWEIDLPLSTEVLATKGDRAVESKLSVYRGSSATVQSAPLADMRLLIVEDEPLVAMDCAEALEGAGATIAGTAGNLDDALRDIGRLQFDAAVLDANLYGRSVDPAAAALTRRGIPFIFVSGYNQEALPKAFLHAPTLSKPYTSDALVTAVQGLRQSPAASARTEKKTLS